jgi:hypothetical protein
MIVGPCISEPYPVLNVGTSETRRFYLCLKENLCSIHDFHGELKLNCSFSCMPDLFMNRLIQKQNVSKQINAAMIIAVKKRRLKQTQKVLERLLVKIHQHQSHQNKITSMLKQEGVKQLIVTVLQKGYADCNISVLTKLLIDMLKDIVAIINCKCATPIY